MHDASIALRPGAHTVAIDRSTAADRYVSAAKISEGIFTVALSSFNQNFGHTARKFDARQDAWLSLMQHAVNVADALVLAAGNRLLAGDVISQRAILQARRLLREASGHLQDAQTAGDGCDGEALLGKRVKQQIQSLQVIAAKLCADR